MLGLEDAAFWDGPLPADGALTDRALAAGLRGPILDGPARVPLAARDTLPALALRVDELAAMREVDLARHGVLVATRLPSGETRAVRLVPPDQLPPARPPRPTRGPVPKGLGSVVRRLELRELARLPWEAGTWQLALVLHGQRSAPLRVALEAPPPAYEDPEVARYLAERRQGFPEHVAPPPALEADGLPSYRPDDAPDPPEAGLALAVDPVSVVGRGCRLRGALRVVPRRSEVVRPAPAEPEGTGWQDVGDADATAVLRVTLVVVATDRPGPAVIELQVPSYDPIPDPAAPGPVTARFAVDLQRLARFDGAVVLWVHAVHGEHLAPPLKAAWVTPEMLTDD